MSHMSSIDLPHRRSLIAALVLPLLLAACVGGGGTTPTTTTTVPLVNTNPSSTPTSTPTGTPTTTNTPTGTPTTTNQLESVVYQFGSYVGDGYIATVNEDMVKGSDGNLYGVTGSGGLNNHGTVFRFDPATNTETVICNFGSNVADTTQGEYPSVLIQGSDGKLYGIAVEGGTNNNGVLFSVDPTTSTETVLYSFGKNEVLTARPGSFLQGNNGVLYFVESNAGATAIASFNLATNTEAVPYTGAAYSANTPISFLLQGTDGNLYAINYSSGAYNAGALLRFNLSTNTLTTLYSFGAQVTDPINPYLLIQGSDGNLYGIAMVPGSLNGLANDVGYLFEFNLSTQAFSTYCQNFVINGPPSGTFSLIQGGNGLFYSASYLGGADGNGAVESCDVSTNTMSTLYSFGTETNDVSMNPVLMLQGADGNLYGLAGGGLNPGAFSTGDGTIFKINLSNSVN